MEKPMILPTTVNAKHIEDCMFIGLEMDGYSFNRGMKLDIGKLFPRNLAKEFWRFQRYLESLGLSLEAFRKLTFNQYLANKGKVKNIRHTYFFYNVFFRYNNPKLVEDAYEFFYLFDGKDYMSKIEVKNILHLRSNQTLAIYRASYFGNSELPTNEQLEKSFNERMERKC